MAWFGNVSLGNFPDLAGAVNKLSESVKNIEKNFDSALGLEEKADRAISVSSSSTTTTSEGIWPSASDRKTLFNPVMAFIGQRAEESSAETSGEEIPPDRPGPTEGNHRVSVEESSNPAGEVFVSDKDTEEFEMNQKDGGEELTPNAPIELYEGEPEAKAEAEVQPEPEVEAHLETEVEFKPEVEADSHAEAEVNAKVEADDILIQRDTDMLIDQNINVVDAVQGIQQKEGTDIEAHDGSQFDKTKSSSSDAAEQTENSVLLVPYELQYVKDSEESQIKQEPELELGPIKHSPLDTDMLDIRHVSHDTEPSEVFASTNQPQSINEVFMPNSTSFQQDPAKDTESVNHDISASSGMQRMHTSDLESKDPEQSRIINARFSIDSTIELDKIRKEMKLMEAALQGAARQAQSKADEIARLMNENEQLKSNVEDLKRKASEADVDALREEYHQRVSSLERKVYALTRERDTLRREQNKKNDAAALLKEKDEIITQVMAEGEELSKKQAVQESTIRKLRAQIREIEEEKQRLNSKLQVEETKVESIKKDKAVTEKLLQETIEKNQAELAAQKEFYTNALNAAKEAESLAESRANDEARTELESRLREADERESMLVQALEELRQTLSRTEQQAVFKEDMLQRDIDDLQKRYQASEMRYNELVTQVPESTRPLLRQIEAMQETAARRAEAWAGVERVLNSRLQEAEAKAAGAEEKERVMNERLSQSVSRITVLETQIACLRTEQTQLSRSLEKERQRASESRQEYLAAMEEAATQEGRAKQLEDEIKELRSKHKRVLREELAKTELLEKALERERIARSELEKSASRQISRVPIQDHNLKRSNMAFENGSVLRKLSSAGSLGSMEESDFLQTSLDSSDSFCSERKSPREPAMSPYFLKSLTPSAFESALRQKDGELASYVSRLASLESIRNSLSEELVKMTEQCEKLRSEASVLPGIKAELEALRRRHSSALELMGERDEALEELRNDIADLKEMYREQVDLLVNKIQVLSSSV